MVDEVDLIRSLYTAETPSLDENVEARIQARIMAGVVNGARSTSAPRGNGSRGRGARRERVRDHRRRLILGAATSVGLAGGAAVAALVLFAGSTPALAQAFPIFSKPGSNVRLPLPKNEGEKNEVELQNARAITTPFGTGYIATAENESELCVAVPAANHRASEAPPYGGRCYPIAQAEQGGFVLYTSMALPPGSLSSVEAGSSVAEFVAVLPAGASNATVDNADGTTTQLTAEDGIVAADEQSPTTITYEAAGRTASFPVGPESTTPGGRPLPGSLGSQFRSEAEESTPGTGSGNSGSATP